MTNLQKSSERKKIIRSVRRIQSALRLEDAALLDILKIGRTRHDRAMSGHADFPAHSLISLSEKYHLTIEQIVSGHIDYRTLANHLSGSRSEIPQRYTKLAFSRMSTVRNLVAHLDSSSLSPLIDEALRRLQISPEAWIDESKAVNVRLTMDFFNFLESRGLNKVFFKRFGHYAVSRVPVGSVHPLPRSKLTMPHLIEEFFSHHVGAFEKNSLYRILKITSEFALIESIEQPGLADALGIPHVTNPATCIYKTAILERLGGALGYTDSWVQETTCIHRAGRTCRFRIEYGSKQDFGAGAQRSRDV